MCVIAGETIPLRLYNRSLIAQIEANMTAIERLLLSSSSSDDDDDGELDADMMHGEQAVKLLGIINSPTNRDRDDHSSPLIRSTVGTTIEVQAWYVNPAKDAMLLTGEHHRHHRHRR